MDLVVRWNILLARLSEMFGKKMTMEAILFLIGMRELGFAPREFSKEEKMDLMHIATCKVFSLSGYYRYIRTDEEGWPHYELVQALPEVDLFSQEYLLKEHVLRYFEAEAIFSE